MTTTAVPNRVIDLTGQKFGRLTVEGFIRRNDAHAKWLCRCDCGGSKDVLGSDLRRGSVKSCGCLKREELSRRYTVEMIGKRFGKLVVLERLPSKPGRWLARWKCRCDCGRETVAAGAHMRSGNSLSCGCTIRKHGGARTREYRIWRGIKSRCLDPKGANYQRYGAVGITMHPAWVDDFAAFIRDIGPAPSPKHTLDRYPNKTGNYEPGNVRWATATQQSRNRTRGCRMLSHGGETLSAAEWGERTGIPRDTIIARLNKGWSDEQALTTPVEKHRPRIHTISGVTASGKAVCRPEPTPAEDRTADERHTWGTLAGVLF